MSTTLPLKILPLLKFEDVQSKFTISQKSLAHTFFLRLYRSTFHKIVETADIISHLAKNTKSSSAKIRKPVVTQQTSTIDASTNKIGKFRTSGYVATATVMPRKQRKSLALQATPLSLPTALHKQIIDPNTDSEEQELAKVPVRRRGKFREIVTRKCEKTT
jgi:hypothetical protein